MEKYMVEIFVGYPIKDFLSLSSIIGLSSNLKCKETVILSTVDSWLIGNNIGIIKFLLQQINLFILSTSTQ